MVSFSGSSAAGSTGISGTGASLILIDDAFESYANLLAAFDELTPQKLVVDARVLVAHKHAVFFVDTLNLSIFDLVKDSRAIIVVERCCFVLKFVVLQVDQLPQMEDVVHSLQHVSDELLLVLDLHGSVGLRQRVAGNGHLDALNLTAASVRARLGILLHR